MRHKTTAIFDAGLQLPAGASAGKVMISDGSGNGSWSTGATLNVYEQPGDPGAVAVGSVWIDTDSPMPIATRPMTYREETG
jgi:hypothetical protein